VVEQAQSPEFNPQYHQKKKQKQIKDKQFFLGLEFELRLRASRLLGRRFYPLSHSTNPFCDGFFLR
jgi:hypothetical protein